MNHPNILPVLAIQEDEQQINLLMELGEGKSLDQFMKEMEEKKEKEVPSKEVVFD